MAVFGSLRRLASLRSSKRGDKDEKACSTSSTPIPGPASGVSETPSSTATSSPESSTSSSPASTPKSTPSSTPTSASFDVKHDNVKQFRIPPYLLPALDYISQKLQSKQHLLTLIVGWDPLQNLMLIPAHPLSPKAYRAIMTIVAKAAKKFLIGDEWMKRLLDMSPDGFEGQTREDAFLVRRSLLQNQVLFSSEGLTLLAIDHVYTFKLQLDALSSHSEKNVPPSPSSPPVETSFLLDPEDDDFDSNTVTDVGKDSSPREGAVLALENTCITTLRRITEAHGHRPITRNYLSRAHVHLPIDDSLLRHINDGYVASYGEIGIAIAIGDERQLPHTSSTPCVLRTTLDLTPEPAEVAARARSEPDLERTEIADAGFEPELEPDRVPEPLLHSRPVSERSWRGPITPNTATDVTPITRNEWNMLMGLPPAPPLPRRSELRC
ncbi:MAG: hypothetical protein M1819_006645 [Sarea resinae]|nr:MAG: hypothetical protein M1819_006645 [Sarea resinae]